MRQATAYQTAYAYGTSRPEPGIILVHTLGGDEADDPCVAVLPVDTPDYVLRATATLLGFDLVEIHRP